MGCDIHLFVEFKQKDWNIWGNFGQQFRLDRDYNMFSKMADVRSYDELVTPMFKPRGIPEDAAYNTKSENRLLIISDDREISDSGYAHESTAKRWVDSGYSKYVDELWVTHPDWHSHSWLTVDEYELCVKSDACAPEYVAILAALRSFELQGLDARVVFWFDN